MDTYTTPIVWHSVDHWKRPSVAQMVLLDTPTWEGGPITYGWLGMDGEWMYNCAIGPAKIQEYMGKDGDGRATYRSPVVAWAHMPETPSQAKRKAME